VEGGGRRAWDVTRLRPGALTCCCLGVVNQYCIEKQNIYLPIYLPIETTEVENPENNILQNIARPQSTHITTSLVIVHTPSCRINVLSTSSQQQ
jgi:hypothetical protein